MAKLLAEGLRCEQGLHEAEDRTISRTHNRKAPGTTGADRTQRKSWQQPGAHQTGFPASGRAGNAQEVLTLEDLLQPVCMLCAAEENRSLPWLEGAEARVGTLDRSDIKHRRLLIVWRWCAITG